MIIFDHISEFVRTAGAPLMQILSVLVGIWSLILVGSIAAQIRLHRKRRDSMTQAIIITILTWILGTAIFILVFDLVWGHIIPNLESQITSLPTFTGWRLF